MNSLLALLLWAPLYAQQLDIKTAPVPDPVKGWHDMTPLSDAELAQRRAPRASPPRQSDPTRALLRAPFAGWDRVHLDQPGDGRIWAIGTTYKASFGVEGVVYVPFLGSDAPQNFPVRFVLTNVRIGGQPLELGSAVPALSGNRVTFVRGAVRESYDLALEQIEQTFVIDSALPGDVEVEVEVISELVEDASVAGLQFGNALGCVHYGAAHVVDGVALRPVPTTFDDNTIRIRVPAAERGPGALVIDPIIQTSVFSGIFTGDSGQPDIAYDASTDQYLLVWQHPFSAADMDVWSEFRNGDGTPIPSSLATIDFTALSHTNPRVANLDAYDRFLVVTQHFDGTLWQIYGRLRLAGAAPHPIVFPISDAATGICVNPDIGGDSGSGDHFLVVWERQLSAFDFDIHARRVRADTTVAPTTILLENTPATIHSLPQVSQSNGNGFTATPCWLCAYQFRFSATDEDIYGAAINQDGTVRTTNTAIDTSSLTDLVPSVSTPATDFGGSVPMFMVTYERQSPVEARARLLTPTFSNAFVNQVSPVNLTQSFGLGGFWVRAESDGCRFAVLSGAATISVATFAYTGTSLVMHEAPQALPTIPSYPRICSKRSSGGTHTDYAIAFADLNWFPDRIVVSAYRGHTAGADVTRRVMGCNGLLIDASGGAFLGETLSFSLSNIGFDIPGFAFSTPAPTSNAVCASCPLGISLAGVVLVVGANLAVPIPCSTSLVGFAGAVQGFAIGSGPCVSSLRFSDTIDFTIG